MADALKSICELVELNAQLRKQNHKLRKKYKAYKARNGGLEKTHRSEVGGLKKQIEDLMAVNYNLEVALDANESRKPCSKCGSMTHYCRCGELV